MQSIITTVSLLFLPMIAFSSPLQDFTAKYKLYHNELYVGDSTRKLTTNKNLLTFTAATETAGLAALFLSVSINEISQLQFKNKQLHFTSYEYDEKNKGHDKHYQFYLDKPQQFYNSYTKKNYPAAKNLQDILGFSIATMLDLKTGQREIKYTIAEKDSLKTYTLKFIKEEKLATNNGYIKTLKMEHYNAQKGHRFTFWCAPEMEFLPVRIRNINHKGDENLFNLSHYNNKAIYLNLEDEEEQQ